MSTEVHVANIYVPPVVKPQGDFPSPASPREELLLMAERIGVILDPVNALVLPDISTPESIESLVRKIAPNLLAARKAIDEAKAAGKHIVYIPGSYDLIHAGHAFYAQQVLDCYMRDAQCQREDIFLVMAADDDELLADVKKSKFKANGGDEPTPRPVEPAAERLLGMAALDVDLVFIIPSPTTPIDKLPSPVQLDLARMQDDLDHHFNAQQRQRIEIQGLTGTERDKELARIAIDNEELAKFGIARYSELTRAYSAIEGLGNVPVQAWQLYIQSYLNGVTEENAGMDVHRNTEGHITRVVSVDDAKYLSQVVYLMHFANIAITLIQDINIGSTSALLKKAVEQYGDNAWEAIRKEKLEALADRFGGEDLATRVAVVTRYRATVERVSAMLRA